MHKTRLSSSWQVAQLACLLCKTSRERRLMACLLPGKGFQECRIKRGPHSRKRLNLCGPHLKRIRLEKHLTLVDIQVTLELDYGIALDRTNLGRIENGERTVTDIELAVLAHMLDVSLADLLWGRHLQMPVS